MTVSRWKRFAAKWDLLARTNAYGAILTGSSGRLQSWDVDEFLSTGRRDAERFVADLRTHAPAAPRARALDFGCGVGRVTQGLAAHFDEVVGVDVAPGMIERARTLNAQPGCTFVLNAKPHLRRFRDGTFSVVYSRLVLQHIAPAIVRRYIPEFVRVLAPGGVLMFQLPDVVSVDPLEAFLAAPVTGSALKRRLPARLVTMYRRLKYHFIADESQPGMHMFGMPTADVRALLEGAGARILDVKPDESHGAPVPGYEYWATRDR